MATYMLFIREGEVVDQDALDQFRAAGGIRTELALKMNVKPLVVQGEMETFEGAAPDGMVLLEFPDKQSTLTWYLSEEVQERVKLLLKSAPHRCIMVQGV